MKTKGSKRYGWQSCDNCGRDFEVVAGDWECPYCGFDNRVAGEIARHAAKIASRKAKEARREPPK
jgi:rubredoxin